MKHHDHGYLYGFVLGLFIMLFYLEYMIVGLNHRINVLEDQMETTMNLMTDDGHEVQ